MAKFINEILWTFKIYPHNGESLLRKNPDGSFYTGTVIRRYVLGNTLKKDSDLIAEKIDFITRDKHQPVKKIEEKLNKGKTIYYKTEEKI